MCMTLRRGPKQINQLQADGAQLTPISASSPRQKAAFKNEMASLVNFNEDSLIANQ